MPAIVPVTSSVSVTSPTSPLVASTGTLADAAVSWIATAISSRRGIPRISNAPLSSVKAWRGGATIIERSARPTRTRALGTGCFAASITCPRITAPAAIVIVTPVRSVLPSSVINVDVPGARSSCVATSRNDPAGSAGNANAPSAPEITASRRSSACWIQSEAPLYTMRAPATGLLCSSTTVPETFAPGTRVRDTALSPEPTWSHWNTCAMPGAKAATW